MFRYFENLVDPYTAYEEVDRPPTKLFPFLWDYAQPFKGVFAITALLAIVVAAVEVTLIYFMGRIVDILGAGSPEEIPPADTQQQNIFML